MSRVLIHSYVKQLSDTLNGDPWVDVSLEAKLQPITDENAFTQPIHDVHSVAQLVSHIYYWSASILSILKGNGRTIKMTDANNWIDNDSLKQKGWDAIKQQCIDNQQQIINFLSASDDSLFDNSYEGFNYEYYAQGLVHHNMYHMGQIGLVIKMLNDK